MKIVLSIKTPKEILDKAFRRVKRINRKESISMNSREKAMNKVSTFHNVVSHELNEIKQKMPIIDCFSPFYKELFNTYLSEKEYKKALYHISWTLDKINTITRESLNNIKNAKKVEEISRYVKSYYGRCSSLIEDLKNSLDYLRESLKIMRRFPTIDESKCIFIVCGYPNVGKSSLINKLTDANIETQPYPFTTKDILVGNAEHFLLIDTPGIMENTFEKLNEIEKKGYLCLKHLSSFVIFVLDPTHTSGFNMEDQKKLKENIIRNFRPHEIVCVVSKSDLISEEKKEMLKNEGMVVSSHTGEGIKELKETLNKIAFLHLSHQLKSFKRKEK